MTQIGSQTKLSAENARQASQLATEARGGGRQRQRPDARHARRHGRDQRLQRPDRQDHQGNRRDRLPDQPAGLERRGGGGPRRASWQRFRGGGGGGAGLGGAQRQGGQARPRRSSSHPMPRWRTARRVASQTSEAPLLHRLRRHPRWRIWSGRSPPPATSRRRASPRWARG